MVASFAPPWIASIPVIFCDVKMLLETQGIDRFIFNGFITYLLSHSRPLAEVMNPRWKDISAIYNQEFSGMTFDDVSLEELIAVPEQMLPALKAQFTQQDFDFLMSFKRGTTGLVASARKPDSTPARSKMEATEHRSDVRK